jgi:hypothetical protein
MSEILACPRGVVALGDVREPSDGSEGSTGSGERGGVDLVGARTLVELGIDQVTAEGGIARNGRESALSFEGVIRVNGALWSDRVNGGIAGARDGVRRRGSGPSFELFVKSRLWRNRLLE